MSRPFFRLLVCAGALIPALAFADSTLVYEEAGKAHLVRIGGGKVRLDPPRGGRWFLFDSARKELFVVDAERQEYRMIDEARAETLRRQLEGAVTLMEDRLARLPPSLQEQARGAMKGVVPLEPKRRAVRLQSTSQRGTAAGLGCEVKQLLVDGKVKGELCLTAAANLGLPPADLAAVLAGQALARSLTDKAERFLAVDGRLFGEGGQVPLIYRPGGSATGWVLTRISRVAVDPGLLQLPAGYRERPLDLPLH